MHLDDLNEVEWLLIREVIPNGSSTGSTKLSALRATVNGILWRMRTGQPWSRVPREYGDHTCICRRFSEWRQTGVTMALSRVRDTDLSPSSR